MDSNKELRMEKVVFAYNLYRCSVGEVILSHVFIPLTCSCIILTAAPGWSIALEMIARLDSMLPGSVTTPLLR